MSIETAEQLKKDLTDKYVVVAEDVPELRRFAGQVGQVRTVNMSGRVLVQFTDSVDISWYDIAPDVLTVVDAPAPKKKAAPAKDKPAAAKPAPKKSTGKKLSPLEMARQQGAAGSGGGTAAAPEAPPATKAEEPVAEAPAKSEVPTTGADGKPLSIIEQARLQGPFKG
jgi:hypothetical protein